MSFTATLLIDGIKGESTTKKHKDEIDITGWSWGAAQESTGHIGSGSGAGKVHVKDITIHKQVDKSSPNLFLACATGKHIAKATLTFTKSGGELLDYYIITIEDLFITSFDTHSNGESGVISESIALKFRSVEIKYQPQDKSGAAQGGSIDSKYNIAELT